MTGTEISDLLGSDDLFQGIFEEAPKPEPQEPEVPPPTLQSTFIEQYYDSAYYYQSQPGIRSDRQVFSLLSTDSIYSSATTTIQCSGWQFTN